jgi:2-furoyl-CoA dehydrogenase large subunit
MGNAIADALAPLGVTVNELPLSPNKIWKLIQEAKAGAKAGAEAKA